MRWFLFDFYNLIWFSACLQCNKVPSRDQKTGQHFLSDWMITSCSSISFLVISSVTSLTASMFSFSSSTWSTSSKEHYSNTLLRSLRDGRTIFSCSFPSSRSIHNNFLKIFSRIRKRSFAFLAGISVFVAVNCLLLLVFYRYKWTTYGPMINVNLHCLYNKWFFWIVLSYVGPSTRLCWCWLIESDEF